MSFLLPSQKADLFHIIVAHQLNPASFEQNPAHDDRGERAGLEFRFKGSRYYFSIRPVYNRFHLAWSPDFDHVQRQVASETWSEVAESFNLWLAFLQRELETPDPWEDIAKFSALVPISPASNASNTQFSHSELQGVWKGLGMIQETLLNECHGAEAHRKLVESQVAFLVESGKTMGRKDWLLIAIGSLVTIAAAMSLSTDTTKIIFQLLKQAVAGAVQLLGAP